MKQMMKTGPFYCISEIGDYTFASYKVVWAEVGNELLAAVVELQNGLPVVPDHTVILISCDEADEAHYLCAMLNSAPARLAIKNYIVLHPSPHVMERVRVPHYEPTDQIHQRLLGLSREAHAIASGSMMGMLADVEREVDECAAQVWGLTAEELVAVSKVS